MYRAQVVVRRMKRFREEVALDQGPDAVEGDAREEGDVFEAREEVR